MFLVNHTQRAPSGCHLTRDDRIGRVQGQVWHPMDTSGRNPAPQRNLPGLTPQSFLPRPQPQFD
jgi:hypothetical protein